MARFLVDEIGDGEYGVYTVDTPDEDYDLVVTAGKDGILGCPVHIDGCEHVKAVAEGNCSEGRHVWREIDHATGPFPRSPWAPTHACEQCRYCEVLRCEAEPVSKWDMDDRV